MVDVFNISLESDLSEFTGTTTAGSGTVTQSGAAALAGSSGGCDCAVTGSGDTAYGYKTFSTPASNEMRFRWYMDINSLTMSNGDTFRLVNLANGFAVEVDFRMLSSNYQIRVTFRDDDISGNLTSWYTVSDAEIRVELGLKRAATTSSNDGEGTLHVDGVLKETVSGLDNNTIFGTSTIWQHGFVQNVDAGTSGSMYIDEIKMTDDADTEIGEVSSGIMIFRRRRAAVGGYF